MGREFTERDNEGARPVALISETVARRYWPHSSPLGSHVTILARVYSGENSGSSQRVEIVGVVKGGRNDHTHIASMHIQTHLVGNRRTQIAGCDSCRGAAIKYAVKPAGR